ncbi:MAG: Rne/Rng family ribonuclease [Ectothiorhodospiraceae bacterium]|nr:Rne/Rng family ribonuclease [Ectothiorhodospiraceae bacterium]
MSAELLVNVTPRETRVAVIENGVLQEIFIERASRRGLVGNIYRGRVCRVLPGMQAAFVDVGLERAAFLHASDVAFPPQAQRHALETDDHRSHGEESRDGQPADGPPRALETASGDAAGPGSAGPFPAPPGSGPRPVPGISELLREGEELLVQVIKDPIGSKGARITTHVSIPSCYLVYMPDEDTVGVSQRIEVDTERARLRDLVRTLLAEPAHEGALPRRGGYIVRTAAEGVADAVVRADMDFLERLWASLVTRARSAPVPSLVHEDLPLVVRTLRELTGTELERVRIDSRETMRRVVEFTRQFIPEMTPRIELYVGERPIFDLYGVEDEIQKALGRKVQLKSGGHLVIDQTEAMTTVDVNTGAYVGHRNLDETIFKTNLEAAQAIARQVRLRNLGGIIIIDFIDMTNEEHKRQVLRALEKSLERDHTKSYVSAVSPLGLVQMTRKRTRESLEHVLCDPCPTCRGRGSIKATDTVCYELFREILREARQYETEKLLVIASREVIDTLVDEESASFAELEAFIGKPITLQVEPQYSREQYDVVLM